MTWLRPLQQQRLAHWWPGALAAIVSGAAFVAVGGAPWVRASAMALAVAAIAMTARPYGGALAVAGALAFAFSPAFWAQTHGVSSVPDALLLLALGGAGGVFLALWSLSKRLFIGVASGVVVFGLLFTQLMGTPRSLRLTTLLAAWLLYLLVSAVRQSHPRPDEPAPRDVSARRAVGLLLLLTLGVLNDPIFVLLALPTALGLWLAHARLPSAAWVALTGVVVWGVWSFATHYVDASWLTRPWVDARTLIAPIIVPLAYRDAHRWLGLLSFVSQQLTLVGALLALLGVARLARWYPTIGVITLVLFGVYAAFGLTYFGRDADVLLLPMLMVLTLWATYAVFALSQWLIQAMHAAHHPLMTRSVRLATAFAYWVLPMVLLLRTVVTMGGE